VRWQMTSHVGFGTKKPMPRGATPVWRPMRCDLLPNYAFIDPGGACGAAGPASAPGLSLGRPTRRTPGHNRRLHRSRWPARHAASVQRKSHLPRSRLSSSRPPRQGRPFRAVASRRPLTQRPLTRILAPARKTGDKAGSPISRHSGAASPSTRMNRTFGTWVRAAARITLEPLVKVATTKRCS
jgi:hypothetical protein